MKEKKEICEITESKIAVKFIDKMLSFFTKKKHNPETVPEKVIQDAIDENGGIASSEGNDFIFVERKNEAAGGEGASSFYPPLPYPGPPDVRFHSDSSKTMTTVPVPYLQDVPFSLAEWLHARQEAEFTQIQVDEILALFTRQVALYDREKTYNFQLERSITEK